MESNPVIDPKQYNGQATEMTMIIPTSLAGFPATATGVYALTTTIYDNVFEFWLIGKSLASMFNNSQNTYIAGGSFSITTNTVPGASKPP